MEAHTSIIKMASQSEIIRVSPDSIHAFATAVFNAAGVPPEHAKLVADSLVLADLRGVDTHGINRVQGYLARVKSGVLNPSPTLSFVSKSPVMAHLDAGNTFGFVAANLAVAKAVEMAKVFGVGIVGVKNSGHFGMAATYLLKAIENEMGALVFTNASRAMPAWGSKEALLGTSPFAVGLPGKNGDHWTLDMSPSVVARVSLHLGTRRRLRLNRNRARYAKRKGEANRFLRVGPLTLKVAIRLMQSPHSMVEWYYRLAVLRALDWQ